ncbi:MATE family efflux transporter [Clostridium sp. D33t1_170424_F3]|uniref:MATE family efflux transporter n=1 Tax=Clostridium sp. D33t1_170424_F3 TaxID=2787099 RepID=UPI00336A4D19
MKQRTAGITDMTSGNPYRLILLFTAPLLLGNVFQQLYNMVDSMVVGNFIGEQALAAVGTGFPIIFMLSSLFMGLSVGATIMISQYYGAKDMENVRGTVNTIYTATMVGIIPLTVIGILSSEPLLRLMNVPDDGTLEMAKIYMLVIFIGMIGNLGFNINAGILQGFGDSRTSLLFLAVAAIINIVLDLVFTFCGMGVFGVALATITAQVASWLFGVYFINKHYTFLHISLFKFQFNRSLFNKAIRLGVPSGIQQALFSVGIMAMQALVNSYGSSFIAGFNGSNKIDTFVFLPIQSISSAVTTYVGQNVGAARLDRVKRGTKAGLVLGVCGSLLISGLVYPLSALLMRMFSQSPDVISAGVSYLHSLLPFYFLCAVLFILSAVLRGAGSMVVPMAASLISLWIARIPIAYWIAGQFGKDFIYYSYPVSWALGVAIVLIYYLQGGWKKRSIITPKT